MTPRRPLALLALTFAASLPLAAATATESFPGRDAIPAALLRADPWTPPARDAAEMQARLVELRARYAPYLRSLPAPLPAPARTSLDGDWLARYEVTNGESGVRPPAPSWHGPDEEPINWQRVLVPEWRWDTIRRPGQWQPWYPASLILWYKRDFEAPPAKAGERVFLCFDGVDWEAEVWLNGERIGSHVGYAEPFRFEVTGRLKKKNTLAVRVFDGPGYGEPISQWSILPFSPSDKGHNQFYVQGRPELSNVGHKPGGNSSGGSGHGIHRSVYLETAPATRVADVFARGYPSRGEARVIIETDATAAAALQAEVTLLPENFEGPSFTVTQPVDLPAGAGRVEFTVKAPEASAWWPEDPRLYRARVTLRDGARVVHARDALFGFREAELVSSTRPRPGLAEGQLLLNGQPVFLRGTSLGGSHNLAVYLGQRDYLLDLCLLVKAANFNFVRNNQHVAFPEVLELFDRLGLMSQQEQGSGYESADHKPKPEHLAKVVAPLARVTYNHPGVIFLSFMNEAHLDMTEPIRAVLAQDPERLLVPISGALFALREPSFADNLLGSFHRYDAWYSGVDLIWPSGDPWPADRNQMLDFKDKNPNPPKSFFPVMRPRRMQIIGEYGAEAVDPYESIQNYPAHWGPTPKKTDNVLWGAIQVQKADIRQIFGFRGQKPRNLGEYIEASQNFQTDILAESTKAYRISNDTILGYYQYFFADLSPAHWPKSVLSFELKPKTGFFEMAQANQPVTPLYRVVEDGAALEFWAANDLALAFPGARLEWRVAVGEQSISGSLSGDIAASRSRLMGRTSLEALPAGPQLLDISLALHDGQGRLISRYARQIYRSMVEVEQARKSAAERAAIRARIEHERKQFIPEVATHELETKLLKEKAAGEKPAATEKKP